MTVRRLLDTRAPAAVILIRLMVGSVFLSEGLQKFLFAASLGSGRFAKIGFTHPELLAPLAGTFEVVCGTLLILGLATRFAALPLLGIILMALVTTKLPILLGTDVGSFHAPTSGAVGFWSAAHEARTDWSMLLGLVFLLLLGGGSWSLDARITGGQGDT